MRDIREIIVILENINSSIGTTIHQLEGIKMDPNSELGSLEYKMKFEQLAREIKASGVSKIDNIIIKEDKESDFANMYENLINQYLGLREIVKDNLKNLKIPVDKGGAFGDAVKAIYGKDKKDLTIDDVNELIEINTTNIEPWDTSKLFEGIIGYKKVCANGQSPCGNFENKNGMADAISTWFSKQLVCLAENFLYLIFTVLLKAPLKFASWGRENKSNRLKYMVSVGALIVPAYALVFIMPFLPLVMYFIIGILLSLLYKPIFYFLSKYYCQVSRKAGDVTDEFYTNICLNIIPPQFDYIYKVKYLNKKNKQIVECYGSQGVSIADNGTLTILKTLAGIAKQVAASYTVIEYNVLESNPIWIEDMKYTDEDDNKDAVPYPDEPGDRTYCVKSDNAKNDPEFMTVQEAAATGCLKLTQTAATLLLFYIAEVITDPEKYGLDDPSSMLAYGVIEKDFNIISGLGLIAAQIDSNKKDSIMKQLDRLYQDSNRSKNEMITALQGGENAMDNSVKEFALTLGNGLLPLGNALAYLYSTMKDMLKESISYEVVCCLLSELINELAAKYNKTGEIVEDVDEFISRYEKYLDLYIGILNLLARIMGNDYGQILKKILSDMASWLISVLIRFLLYTYNFLTEKIGKWIDSWLHINTKNVYLQCLPFEMLQGLVKELYNIFLSKLSDALSYIMAFMYATIKSDSKITGQLSFSIILYTIKGLLVNIKNNLNLLSECLNIDNRNTLNDYFDSKNEHGNGLSGVTDDENGEVDGLFSPSSFLFLKASNNLGKPLTINKAKYIKFLEAVSSGDSNTISAYVNGKKQFELIEERTCNDNKLHTLKELLKINKINL